MQCVHTDCTHLEEVGIESLMQGTGLRPPSGARIFQVRWRATTPVTSIYCSTRRGEEYSIANNRRKSSWYTGQILPLAYCVAVTDQLNRLHASTPTEPCLACALLSTLGLYAKTASSSPTRPQVAKVRREWFIRCFILSGANRSGKKSS